MLYKRFTTIQGIYDIIHISSPLHLIVSNDMELERNNHKYCRIFIVEYQRFKYFCQLPLSVYSYSAVVAEYFSSYSLVRSKQLCCEESLQQLPPESKIHISFGHMNLRIFLHTSHFSRVNSCWPIPMYYSYVNFKLSTLCSSTLLLYRNNNIEMREHRREMITAKVKCVACASLGTREATHVTMLNLVIWQPCAGIWSRQYPACEHNTWAHQQNM